MRAVVLEEAGAAENLSVVEREALEVTPGHVLIRVHACGVAFRDVIDRSGGLPFMKLPVVLGHEFAGRVEAVGEGVSRWKVGDRVLSLHRDYCGLCAHCIGGDERHCADGWEAFGVTVDGGYADQVLAGERAIERLPEEIPFHVGAALMSAAGVAWHNVAEIVAVRPGETVIVTGASGGVGAHAVQASKLLGARVWAVTSSADKADRLRELGADDVLVSTDGRFHKEVQQRTDGRGVDAVIDCVGPPTLNASLRSLRRRGRVCIIGNVDQKKLELNVGLLVVQALQVFGSDGVSRASLRTTLELVRSGKLHPVLGPRFPLEKVVEAHRLLEARGSVGRVMLDIAPEGD